MLLLNQNLSIVLFLELDLLLLLNELLPQVSLLPVKVKENLHVLVQLGLLLILDYLGDLADLARIFPPRFEDLFIMDSHLTLLRLLLVLEFLDSRVQHFHSPILEQAVGLFVDLFGLED